MQGMIPNEMDFGVDHIRVNRFSEESAIKFHVQLTRQSTMDPTCPIIVYIDSYGGSVDALASMIETMESVPNKIVTVCTGKAMSCGVILLAAGDYRFCGKNSRVLIHEITSAAVGDPYDIKSSSDEIMRLNEYWLDFFAKKCGMESYADFKDTLNNHGSREITLDAHGAKAFGIVDDVGLPTIRPLIMYQIDTLSDKGDSEFLKEDNINEILGIEEVKDKKPARKIRKKAGGRKTSKKVKKKKA